MRILIIHNEYSAPSGEEHALRAIAALLEENGHQVLWFLRSSAGIQGVSEKAKAFFTGIHSPEVVRSLRRFLKKHSVDLALVQNLYPLLSPSVFPVLRRAGIPVVMRCPNYRLFCPNGLFLDTKGRVCEKCTGKGKEFWMVYKNCMDNWFQSLGYAMRGASARIRQVIHNSVDVFIVQTEFQKQKFMEKGISKDRICIVPGLTPEVTMAENSEPGKVVSFVGRVSHEKGITEFLEAAARLPDIPFAVAGNISMPDIQDDAPPNVRWMGFLQGRDLDDFFLNSRMTVVPSRWYEGFPNVITRAMRFSRPVIAADMGAMSSIVDDGVTGLKFSPGNAVDLASKIVCLYDNLPLCEAMGRAGYEKAVAVYSQGEVYRRLMGVCGKVLSVKF